MPDLVKLAARLNAYRAEVLDVARELMTQHVGKSAEWIVARKRRLDWLDQKISRLEKRLR